MFHRLVPGEGTQSCFSNCCCPMFSRGFTFWSRNVSQCQWQCPCLYHNFGRCGARGQRRQQKPPHCLVNELSDTRGVSAGCPKALWTCHEMANTFNLNDWIVLLLHCRKMFFTEVSAPIQNKKYQGPGSEKCKPGACEPGSEPKSRLNTRTNFQWTETIAGNVLPARNEWRQFCTTASACAWFDQPLEIIWKENGRNVTNHKIPQIWVKLVWVCSPRLHVQPIRHLQGCFVRVPPFIGELMSRPAPPRTKRSRRLWALSKTFKNYMFHQISKFMHDISCFFGAMMIMTFWYHDVCVCVCCTNGLQSIGLRIASYGACSQCHNGSIRCLSFTSCASSQAKLMCAPRHSGWTKCHLQDLGS